MNFDIKELDFKFDYTDYRNYYNYICRYYPHLKFTNDLIEDTVDSEKHNISGVYGFGIQSNLADLDVPCPPWNVHKEGSDNYRDTALVFGPILDLKEKFPNSRQYSISGHPPGTIIQQHIDTDKYLKIHIPITTNSDAYFVFGNSKYCLTVGKAYLINTTRPHGTINFGRTDRVHLFFKVLAEDYL
jgi:hypothetical protein